MRNAFAAELLALAEENNRIVLLSGDMGNNLFNAFKQRFPHRFINCGAAEANMTGVAAGMALAGLLPITYSIASFNPGRCAEQVRLDICLQNLPVIVVGVGAGFSYASLGPTHHSLEDIAWMRSLPNMTVVCPGDAVETRCAIRAAVHHGGPVYLRLGKKNEPIVHSAAPDFVLGKGISLCEGADACLLSVGTLLPLAVEAAQALSSQGITTEVVSMHTVKPLDTELLQRIFSTKKVVAVLEEHVPAGGAWSAIAEWLCMNQCPSFQARFVRCGAADRFYTQGGNTVWARQCSKLTVSEVSTAIAIAVAQQKP